MFQRYLSRIAAGLAAGFAVLTLTAATVFTTSDPSCRLWMYKTTNPVSGVTQHFVNCEGLCPKGNCMLRHLHLGGGFIIQDCYCPDTDADIQPPCSGSAITQSSADATTRTWVPLPFCQRPDECQLNQKCFHRDDFTTARPICECNVR